MEKINLFYIFLGILAFLWFFISLDNGGFYESQIFENLKDDYSSTEETHWKHMPLNYSYGVGCVGLIIERVEDAFNIIENDTDGLVSFKKVETGGDIKFICYETQRVSDGFITEALAFANISGNIINSAEIEIWSVSENTRPESCWNFPRLELQEILHIFDFDHVEDDYYSVLYPYSVGCVAKDALITKYGKTFVPEDKLDDEVTSCLKYIYSDGIKGNCDDIKLIWLRNQ